MKTFEYQDVLRVTVGQLTRAQQLDFWRDGHLIINSAESEKSENGASNNMLTNLLLEDSVTVLCTTKIEVCKDGKWKPVSKPVKVSLNGEDYEVSHPMTLDRYRQLPMSLTNRWSENAIALNGDVSQVLFLASVSRTRTESGSKQPSENAQ